MPAEKLDVPFGALLSELYEIPKDSHGRYRSQHVYRGLDVASWGLETSLQRLGDHYESVESPILRNFLKYSQDRELASQPVLYQLAVAQHHGLPTRVLDWTSAPRVALHFAVGDENLYNEDGVIWCVNITKVHSILPEQLRRTLDDHRAALFSAHMLPEVKTLAELKQFGDSSSFPIFFEPPSLDGRIVNQAAVLSVSPNPTFNLLEFLERDPSFSRKIIVPKELKWEIRDKLDQDQVNERTLFPGLDGTTRWLKRYYGPGANRTSDKNNLA